MNPAQAATCLLASCLALAGCGQAASGPGADSRIPGQDGSTQPYGAIGEAETVYLTGTEPFWGGEVGGETLTYETPENPDGRDIRVERFAGRGGISWSGSLDGASLDLAVTPISCSDGMSDRTYPFTATLQLGDETRSGCAWTDERPFTGPTAP
ncbi:hypothetical protein G7A66_05855 [Altererythrobacter sp. SALINAS58]|nr:hypothetical protein [Alteripontixanthobacter muriae]